MTKPITFIVPAFYKNFQCRMSACDYNCCERGWRIDIDKNTYELYKTVKDPEFKDDITKYIKRDRKHIGHDNGYAKLVLDENGICPFLKDGLCSLQKKLGYNHLSHTCKIFPRMTPYLVSVNPPRIHAGLSMACRHVAKLCVTPTEPLTFEEITLDRTKDIHAKNKLNGFNTQVEPLSAFAMEIQQLCIDVMQCRKASLPDRLFVVGTILQKLCESDNIVANFEHAIKYATALANGEFNGITEKFSDNQEAKATMKMLLVKTFGNFMYSSAFSDFVKLINERAEKDGKTPEEIKQLSYTDMNKYSEEFAELHWARFLEKNSHMLENYFVNYIFTQHFPFTHIGEISVYHHFILLAEQYALMRLIFSAAGEKVDEKYIINAMSEIFQAVSHSINTAELKKRYTEAGLDSLAHISFLLRK